MPGRNITKQFAAENYYHIYNRGINKRRIFVDEEDYRFFTGLFARYIDNRPSKDSKGREYPWYGQRLSLLAYCLMPNHFHLLVYQEDETAMTEFMLSFLLHILCTSTKSTNAVGPCLKTTTVPL